MTENPIKEVNISLSALLEALLFVAPGTLSPRQLANVLGISLGDVRKGLQELDVHYAQRGLQLQRHGKQVQLTTTPEIAPWVEQLLGLDITSRLSRAALETLSIIAYKQPSTRPQIDAIRGVNSDGVMKTLLSKGLIQEVGRAPGPGRPILYSTTPDFLGYFGISSLDQLPPLFDKDDQSSGDEVTETRGVDPDDEPEVDQSLQQ